jgi:hypothetical protein
MLQIKYMAAPLTPLMAPLCAAAPRLGITAVDEEVPVVALIVVKVEEEIQVTVVTKDVVVKIVPIVVVLMAVNEELFEILMVFTDVQFVCVLKYEVDETFDNIDDVEFLKAKVVD